MEKASLANTVECFGNVKYNRTGFTLLVKDLTSVISARRSAQER